MYSKAQLEFAKRTSSRALMLGWASLALAVASAAFFWVALRGHPDWGMMGLSGMFAFCSFGFKWAECAMWRKVAGMHDYWADQARKG